MLFVYAEKFLKYLGILIILFLPLYVAFYFGYIVGTGLETMNNLDQKLQCNTNNYTKFKSKEEIEEENFILYLEENKKIKDKLILDRLVKYISEQNPLLSNIDVNSYATSIIEITRDSKIKWFELAAFIAVESSYDPNATSSDGAKGMMQIMPKIWTQELVLMGKIRNESDLIKCPTSNIQCGLYILEKNFKYESYLELVRKYNGAYNRSYLKKLEKEMSKLIN